MIKYILKKYMNPRSSIFRKWLAYPVIDETLDLAALAKHMANHSSPYSEGVIYGVLKDMVKCIKEQLLEGKNVKIDDLAIFSVGIKNSKGGADSEEVFNVTKHISSVKLRARATGELIAKNLNLDASLRKASATTASQGTDAPTNGGNNGGGTTGGNSGGSTGGNSGTGNTGGNNGGSTGGNSGTGNTGNNGGGSNEGDDME